MPRTLRNADAAAPTGGLTTDLQAAEFGAQDGQPRERAEAGSLTDFAWVITTHAIIDVFPMMIISLMIVLQNRLALTPWQETAVWVVLPIFSGAFQPLFAWWGDRYNTRLAGPIGLVIGGVCIGSIGFAQNFWQLIALQAIGVIGVGVYHPAAAATAGQIGARTMRGGRTFALSLFVGAGMVGHTIGPILATRLNAWFGMEHLAWVIPPTLIAAVMLLRSMRHVSHRPDNHHELHASMSRQQFTSRWIATALLSLQNSVRFTVNNAMYILFSYWAAWRLTDTEAASILHGNLTAATTIGMGIGAILSVRLFRPGTERWSFAISAFGGALFVACINTAGQFAPLAACGAATCAAIGFFATIPASVGLGQRLLPAHASLATALLLGVGWMFGALSRPLVAALLGVDSLEDAAVLSHGDFTRGFVGMAALLSLAGVFALLMPRSAVHEAAHHD